MPSLDWDILFPNVILVISDTARVVPRLPIVSRKDGLPVVDLHVVVVRLFGVEISSGSGTVTVSRGPNGQ